MVDRDYSYSSNVASAGEAKKMGRLRAARKRRREVGCDVKD